MRAVVDIGSNSVKFLIAEIQRGAVIPVEKKSWITRLGRDLEKKRLLSPESVSATVAALKEMKVRLGEFKELDPKQLIVVATSAVRDCLNPEAISAPVERIFGVRLTILSGIDEARLSMRGASAAAARVLGQSDCIFIDVGGASTELGELEPSFQARSFQAGAVRRHERLHLNKIPVDDVVWESAKKEMKHFFEDEEFIERLAKNHKAVVAAGGTLMLAAHLAGAKSHKDIAREVELSALEKLNEKLRGMPLAKREQLPEMEKGRADIICAGILCLTSLLRLLKRDKVLVTSWGLRHGILLSGGTH